MGRTEIIKGIEAIGKALWLKKEKILVIADLHLGYEQQLNEKGVLVLRKQFQEIKKELEELIKEVLGKSKKIKKIVILGDLKHAFGQISSQEWRETSEVIDLLNKNCEELIVIKGNHDAMLEPILNRKNIKLRGYFIEKEVCFFHGDKIWMNCYDKKIKIWIIGHKHPAITIREGHKKETYKCFLSGNYDNKKVIILPSFFPLIEGADVFIYDTHFAFDLNEKDFGVFIVGKDNSGKNKIYRFGKVKDIGKLNS